MASRQFYYKITPLSDIENPIFIKASKLELASSPSSVPGHKIEPFIYASHNISVQKVTKKEMEEYQRKYDSQTKEEVTQNLADMIICLQGGMKLPKLI